MLAETRSTRQVAASADRDEVIAWLQGPGRSQWERMRQSDPDRFADPGEWVDSLIDRVKIKTMDDPELVDAIRTREFRGKPIVDGQGRPSRELRSYLKERRLAEETPGIVKGQRVMADVEQRMFNWMSDHIFAGLMGNRTARPVPLAGVPSAVLAAGRGDGRRRHPRSAGRPAGRHARRRVRRR